MASRSRGGCSRGNYHLPFSPVSARCSHLLYPCPPPVPHHFSHTPSSPLPPVPPLSSGYRSTLASPVCRQDLGLLAHPKRLQLCARKDQSLWCFPGCIRREVGDIEHKARDRDWKWLSSVVSRTVLLSTHSPAPAPRAARRIPADLCDGTYTDFFLFSLSCPPHRNPTLYHPDSLPTGGTSSSSPMASRTKLLARSTSRTRPPTLPS